MRGGINQLAKSEINSRYELDLINIDNVSEKLVARPRSLNVLSSQRQQIIRRMIVIMALLKNFPQEVIPHLLGLGEMATSFWLHRQPKQKRVDRQLISPLPFCLHATGWARMRNTNKI